MNNKLTKSINNKFCSALKPQTYKYSTKQIQKYLGKVINKSSNL